MYLSTVRRLPRPRYRRRGVGATGLGSTWVFSVSPGDPCYDPSHSAGETHYRLWFPGMSASETNCLAGSGSITLTNPGALTPGLPVGYDPTTGAIDPSNTTGDTVLPTQAQIQSAFSSIVPPGADGSASPDFPWGAVVAAFGVAFGLMWLGGGRR